MHQFGFREVTRTVLTIAGIMLLVIFGTRAASQASSVAAVGGQAKHNIGLLRGDPDPLETVTLASASYPLSYVQVAEPKPVLAAAPPAVPAESKNLQQQAQQTISVAVADVQTSKQEAVDMVGSEHGDKTTNMENSSYNKEEIVK